jgi:hypothetical protein
MTRHFTDDELVALARTPRQQFADACATSSGDDAVAVFVLLAKSFRNFIDGFSAFVAGVAEYVREEHGFDAASALDAAVFKSGLRELAARGVDPATIADLADADTAAAVRERLLAGDQPGALTAYDAYEARVRDLHDIGVGRPAAALSHVYRTFGVDALEACIRVCGDKSLLNWMPHDLTRPAHVRVLQWARMMSGNFAEITVDETDDAFVITQNPCGTCGRQVLDGCYAPPIDFAVVAEPHAITWGRGDVPVYRTHVAVMHDLMPLERIGTRWPEITCPQGVSGGECTVVLRK